MKIGIHTKVIEWSLEHRYMFLEMFENTFDSFGDSVRIHDDVYLIFIIYGFSQKVQK